MKFEVERLVTELTAQELITAYDKTRDSDTQNALRQEIFRRMAPCTKRHQCDINWQQQLMGRQ